MQDIYLMIFNRKYGNINLPAHIISFLSDKYELKWAFLRHWTIFLFNSGNAANCKIFGCQNIPPLELWAEVNISY